MALIWTFLRKLFNYLTSSNQQTKSIIFQSSWPWAQRVNT